MTPPAGLDPLGRLAAIEEIRAVVLRYCRGVDRLDVDLLRSTYLPGAVDDHGVFVGDAAEFCARVVESHRRYDATLHCVTNHLVELDGPDDARGEAYVQAHVLRRDDAGAPVHDTWWGRYADRYARRDGRWGIAHRVVVHEWTRREPRGAAMRADTGLFRQGSEDRGTGAGLGPDAFPPRVS
ncbi:nuclear transport factor 2 family protein [Blastococcus sp. SYSU D00669]